MSHKIRKQGIYEYVITEGRYNLLIIFCSRNCTGFGVTQIHVWRWFSLLTSHVTLGKLLEPQISLLELRSFLTIKMKWKCFSHVWLFLTSKTVTSQALYPWNSPGKHTGVGSHSLLQGIFLTQRSNSDLLNCRKTLYHLSHWEGFSWWPWSVQNVMGTWEVPHYLYLLLVL